MSIPPSLIFAVVDKVTRMVLVKKSANGDKVSWRDISVAKIVALLVAAAAAYFLGGDTAALDILKNIGAKNGTS